MRFGNTIAVFRRGLSSMLLLGLAADLALVFVGISHHTLAANWPLLAILPFGLPAILSLAIAPTLLFSIHIEDGRVRHMFLDRYVLTDLPATDFENLLLSGGGRYMGRLIAARAGFTSADFDRRPSGPWAATLYFRHGRKIRFFGAHMRVLRSLKDALMDAKNQRPVAAG